MKNRLLAALAAALAAVPAGAHCPVSYVVTGPAGLYWEIDIAGSRYPGMLPSGTPSQLGGITSWSDVRRIGGSSGVITVGLTVTDGSHYAVCPALSMNLSGPPSCNEDFDAPNETDHAACAPYFTVVQTSPGVFSCSSTCQPLAAYPVPQDYTPPATPAPTVSAIFPSSATVSGAPVALSVSGSGFTGGATVRWNGVALSTLFLSASSVLALVPKSLLSGPGNASVAVANPGSVSAPMTFTITP